MKFGRNQCYLTKLESPQMQTDHRRPFWQPSSLAFIGQNPFSKLGEKTNKYVFGT